MSISIGDIFFWIGVTVGVLAVLFIVLVAVVMIYVCAKDDEEGEDDVV